jgi:hypothetical protein
MKIYINNYTPDKLLKKMQILDSYFNGTKNNTEIISDDGIFSIDKNNFYKINIILDELKKLKTQQNIELLLDKSTYNRDIVYQLPLEHIILKVTTFYYVVNPKSKIKLVIDGIYENDCINDIINENRYHDFIPINFYFEVPNEKKDFELLNNDDLNVFFSILN